MHISLDSALGRDIRLNRIGETISTIAAPDAAYSLRSLTGGDPKVVRVRRESDNNERDFTSSEVNSGALVNFVNAQTVKPLDIQALQSDGRTGDFQIASAAYSLRSLGNRQATVPATGDTVPVANGKYVIQVRRSSDDTIKSFTADEVTDGTLEAFVGSGNDGFVRKWYDQSVTDQGGDTATGNHATQTDTAKQPKIVSSGSLVTSNSLPAIDFTTSYTILTRQEFLTGQLNSYFTITETDVGSDSEVVFRQGNNYRLSNEYSGTSGSISSQLRDGAGDNANVSISSDFGNGNIRLTTTLITARGANGHTVFVDGGNETSNNSTNIEDTNFASADSGDFGIGGIPSNSSFDFHGKAFEFIFYNSDQTNNRGALEGNMADHYSITGVPTGANTVDGFVETWYDQSGNSNDITQTDTAKQPKIVNSGSLVTSSSKPALKFDGTNDFLEKETFTQGTFSQPNTFFAVAKLDSNDDTNRKIFDSHNSTGRNMLFLSPTNAGEIGFFATAVITTGETADANNNLFTALYDGTSSVLRVNTVQKAAGNVGTMSMIGLIIGESHNQNSNVWKGNIQEIIIYNSDQTSKFTALETNIKNNYSIS